ncbi:MAG: glycosyltransferase [Flavobacteriaceae bacterium]|nr:glycosyltransferase [Flavobacteriaceae bacterium]
MKELAPICLFTYNRLDETKQTVKALQNNFLANESELFVFSDGSKKDKSKKQIDEVRVFLKTIKGFKKVTIFESDENKGLANSIISGVSKIIKEYGKVIVLEDDLISSRNFLNFMNHALIYYEHNRKIFSISGYTLRLPSLNNFDNDYYLGYRASSWGWATWTSNWVEIDWLIEDYQDFNKNRLKKKKFNKGGSDMSSMLKTQMKGKIDSWAIRWCYNQFKNQTYTVFPSISKIVNIGFGVKSTHTKSGDQFDTILDDGKKIEFVFSNEISINEKLMKEFRQKYSIITRIKRKFLK